MIRRWIRVRYDYDQQHEHGEERYELLRDGVVIRSEEHGRSPSLRWQTQDQMTALFEQAGFSDIRITSRDTFVPARPDESTFKVLGVRR